MKNIDDIIKSDKQIKAEIKSYKTKLIKFILELTLPYMHYTGYDLHILTLSDLTGRKDSEGRSRYYKLPDDENGENLEFMGICEDGSIIVADYMAIATRHMMYLSIIQLTYIRKFIEKHLNKGKIEKEVIEPLWYHGNNRYFTDTEIKKFPVYTLQEHTKWPIRGKYWVLDGKGNPTKTNQRKGFFNVMNRQTREISIHDGYINKF
jgi:hypothetical protein